MWVGGRGPVSAEVREVFWRVRGEGAVIADAAVSAGVSYGAATRWISQAGGVRPRRPVVSSGRFLSLVEREEIARRLGRPASTVCREIARNQLAGGRYRALAADRQARGRAVRPKPAKLAVDAELRGWVQDRLTQRWSPAEISARLRQEFPDRLEMRVSHETIYQSIYVQGRGALRRELAACLRTGRAIRRPKRRTEQRRVRITDMIMISERPAEVEDRAVPGHWEGDLITGKDNGSAIGTLVERS